MAFNNVFFFLLQVRQLANDFSNKPIHIQLGLGGDSGLTANEQIKQHLILLQSEEHKDEELMNLLRSKVKSSRDLVLIFVARKNTCDFVTNMLNRVGFRAAAMHSDRDQKHREATLADFKDGRIPIMVIIMSCTVFFFTKILKTLQFFLSLYKYQRPFL